jgi:hypothetical protein
MLKIRSKKLWARHFQIFPAALAGQLDVFFIFIR